MISLKQQLNDAINQSDSLRKLSTEELTALKACILKIYKDVDKLCKDNNLTLMLTGGSCLGAIRHKGFIPWDDDLDLMMPRGEYNKLLKLCEDGALGDNYEFTYPSKEHDAPCAFLKIYLKNSKIVGLGGISKKYPNGVFIDIFPIEGAPKSIRIRKLKGLFANTLRLCANMVDASGKWPKEVLELYKNNRKLYLNMKCRQIIGRVLSVISHKRWICWYDAFIKNEAIGEFAVIPTGRKLYVGETLPSEVYFPPSKGEFEGMEVNLPANPDAYLKNLYGDYMWIPPEEKRESHFVMKLEIPDEFYRREL